MPRRSHDIRLLLLEVGLPLLLFALIDAGFGSYVARNPAVPLPQLFGADPLSTGKFLALRERALRPGTIDVLLLGMSPMMRVNGEQLEAQLGERTHRPVRAFNFSGPYHSFAFDELLIRDLIAPIANPAIVVCGITPLTLLNEVFSAEQTQQRAAAMPIMATYVGSPIARLRSFVTMHLSLLRYREVIREALERPLGWKVPPFDQQAHATTPTGDVPLAGGHFVVQGPAPWERTRRERFADFDAVVRDTLLFDNLAEFARFCRERGIELVLLNNPVHPLFVDFLPRQRQDYDRYLALVRQAAAQAQVPLFEPAPDGLGQPDLYNDTVHHNEQGGAWLTEQLAGYLAANHLITAEPAPRESGIHR